ncbi:MAG: type II secretion system protein N [Pseudomonadota bacterium]
MVGTGCSFVSSLSQKSAPSVQMLRLLVEVGLTVILAMITGNLIWSVIAPNQGQIPSSQFVSSPPAANRISATQPPDRSILVRQNPFVRSEVESETLPSQPTDIDAPETELNLKLTGIRAFSNDDFSGSVWIVKPDGEEVVVGISEAIIDGVTLERIYTDRVTIRSRGRLESLSRREEELSFAAASEAVLTDIQDRGPERPSRSVNVKVSPIELFNSTAFDRLVEDGVILGFRLSPTGDGGAFGKAGFKQGDLLISLNGRSVAKFEDDDFVDFFLQQNRVEALVEREGLDVSIPLTFAEDS